MREYLFCLAISKNKLSNSSKKGKFRALLLTAYSFAFLASLPVVREPPFAFQKFSSFPRLTKVWKEKSFRVQGGRDVPLRPPLSDEFFDSFAHLGKGRSVRKQESLGGDYSIIRDRPLMSIPFRLPFPKGLPDRPRFAISGKKLSQMSKKNRPKLKLKVGDKRGRIKCTIVKDGDSWSFGQTPGGNQKTLQEYPIEYFSLIAVEDQKIIDSLTIYTIYLPNQ